MNFKFKNFDRGQACQCIAQKTGWHSNLSHKSLKIHVRNIFNAVPVKKRLNLYSGVPNKRVGWNKHVGWKISQKLINVLFLIKVLVGNFKMSINANWLQISDLTVNSKIFW